MKLQFQSSGLKCLQKVAGEVKNTELTQELKLPDTMPDIGRVLGAWGQLLIRGKEWRSDHIAVSGGVMVWVLYTPEEGGAPQCLETWIPFQSKWDIADTQRDGVIRVSGLLRFVDARSISARKMMLRAGASILAQAWLSGQTELATPDEVPEDIRLLRNTYPVRLPVETGEKPFALDEELPLSGSGGKPEKLVYYTLQPQIMEQKVMSDKAVFRGVAMVHVLYRTEAGEMRSYDVELPFSQYAELEAEHNPDAEVRVVPAVTSLEIDLEENGGLHLKAGLTGQYMIYDKMDIALVEDAYSPIRDVQVIREELMLPALLEERSESVTAEKAADVTGTQVVDVTFYPDRPDTTAIATDGTVTLGGQFQMLYYDAEGSLQSVMQRWEDQQQLRADETCEMDIYISLTGKPQASMGADTTLRADVQMQFVIASGAGMPMIRELEIGQCREPDPNRPSLILRAAGTDGLWDLAKRTGSTVEAIQKANGLEQEPLDGRLLLIPIQ